MKGTGCALFFGMVIAGLLWGSLGVFIWVCIYIFSAILDSN